MRSDIPTLLMNGGHDPVTPPWEGRTAAETLSRHYLFEFGSSGHGTVWQNWISPCPADIARQFLTDPTRRPDAACMASMTPASFLTTDDIHPTPAIYRLTDDLVRRPDTAQIALLGACGATFAVGLLAGIVALIRRRGGWWEAAVTVAVSAVALGYAGTLYAVLRSSDTLVLGFGVPAAARPLFLAVGSLMALATQMVIGVAARSWVRRSCSVPLRVLVSVVAGASLLFTAPGRASCPPWTRRAPATQPASQSPAASTNSNTTANTRALAQQALTQGELPDEPPSRRCRHHPPHHQSGHICPLPGRGD